MQPRIRRLPLLLVPLLAAACAPAVAASASAPAPDLVSARRAGQHALDVNAAQPLHAYVLEVRPDREEVLQLLNGGQGTALAPGRQRMELDAAAGATSSRTADVRVSGYDRRYCGSGERLIRTSGPEPRAGAQSMMRPVNVRGRRAYCVREFAPASSPTRNGRQPLLLLASAEPVAPEVLNEIIASLNARFASAPLSGDVIYTVTVNALRERGIQPYVVRVR
jgi:hypothetical protein